MTLAKTNPMRPEIVKSKSSIEVKISANKDKGDSPNIQDKIIVLPNENIGSKKASSIEST